MKEKIQWKNTFLQLTVGVLAYYFFIRKTPEAIAQTISPELSVGDLQGEGFEYIGVYFKDSEYFGKYEKPEKYLSNYFRLLRQLDKIREKFGSAILIKKGYSPSFTGLITDTFQICQSVEIYPQNGNVSGLAKVINDNVSNGYLTIIESVRLSNNNIKISVNG